MAEGGVSGPRARRHRGRPNRTGGWLGLVVLATTGALTLSLVGVLAWAAVFNDGDSTGPQATGQTTSQSEHSDHTTSPAPSSPESSASPLLARTGSLKTCVAEVAAADAEVAAARTGIGHWAEHIQARTNLLSGALPKEVTKAVWKRTREAGPADLTRYQQAVAEHARQAGSCARAAGSAGAELSACRQRLRILDKAVAAGAAGMGDWRAHQNAMAAHKAGEIDAAHAQTMWVTAWAAAPKNIDAFKAADTALRTAPACHT